MHSEPVTGRHLADPVLPEPNSAGRHVQGRPHLIVPAFTGSPQEVPMTTDDGKATPDSALDLLPERYRSLFWSLFSTLGATGLLILDLLANGRPLGGVELAMVVIGIGTNIAVWWPKSHVAKFISAVVGAMAMSIEAALTDGRVTPAEGVVILLSFASAFGLSLQPNARVVAGEVVESPVPSRVEVTEGLPANPRIPGGSTYLPPSQAGPLD